MSEADSNTMRYVYAKHHTSKTLSLRNVAYDCRNSYRHRDAYLGIDYRYHRVIITHITSRLLKYIIKIKKQYI